MIDVLQVEEGFMGEILECFEVVVLIGEPVGVHLPEHPLRGHLKESAASPCVAHGVGRYLQLERVAQLMCHAVHLLVLNAVGSHPKRSNEIVVGATISCTVERVVHHHHHFVLVALGTRFRES